MDISRHSTAPATSGLHQSLTRKDSAAPNTHENQKTDPYGTFVAPRHASPPPT